MPTPCLGRMRFKVGQQSLYQLDIMNILKHSERDSITHFESKKLTSFYSIYATWSKMDLFASTGMVRVSVSKYARYTFSMN